MSPSFRFRLSAFSYCLAAWLGLFTSQPPVRAHDASRYFAIQVVDDQTGRGVPLVELRTVHEVRWVTDSAGLVAFDEPGLMDRDVFFHVSSHGYEYPADGFGYRGKTLRTTPGTRAVLKIKRLNLAERLYRVTGAGIYRDSQLLGEPTPLGKPLLNAEVLGSDSVLTAEYQDKLFWFWGDTNRLRYPLGNFQVTGATSKLLNRGGLDAAKGVDFDYLTGDKGFVRPLAKMPGSGPTWLTAVATLPDAQGRDRMVATYVKVKPPLEVYARGIALWNGDSQEFEHRAAIDMKALVFPEGHTLRHSVGGVEYLYFATPYALLRTRATVEDFERLERYEAFTCLRDGSRLEEGLIDRDEQGRARYVWRKNTPFVGPADQAKLIAAGKLKGDEAWLRPRDRDSGEIITLHAGSVAYNAFRRRWIMLAVQSGGRSYLGEMWYAESDQPHGPWHEVVRIATHTRYSFYNPKHHPQFDAAGGRYIFFEGTYTHTFSGNNEPTPRYDYNQVMYRLDLSDERLRGKAES